MTTIPARSTSGGAGISYFRSSMPARSGTEAAMGPEGRQVGRLVEKPEPFPIVADLPEVFGVDQQLLNPLGRVGRIVRQRHRGTSLAQGEGGPHEDQDRQGFPHSGLPPDCV